jgi:hypothetical protein
MQDRRPRFLLAGRRGGSWAARAAFAVLGLAIAVLAVFFITVALIVGTAVAVVVAIRWWWILRRVKAAREAAGPIEGEFTRVEGDRRR